MPDTPPTIFIPSVFFGPEKLPEGIASNESSQYRWLLDSALPLLRGQQLSKKIQQHSTELHQEATGDCISFPSRDYVISFFK